MTNTADNSCIENPTYQDYVDNGYQAVGCGSASMATIYFTVYSLMVSIVFLSLFIAIVLSGYFVSNEKHKKESIKYLTLRFQRAWALFDP